MSMLVLEEQLRESACYGDVDAMVSLLKSGVNVNAANTMNGWTPLHWACKRGNNQCKEMLLSWGADINIANINGETPMDLQTVIHKFQRQDSPSHEKIIDEPTQIERLTDRKRRALITNQNTDFIPNYLKHPEINHKVDVSGVVEMGKPQGCPDSIANNASDPMMETSTIRQSTCNSKNDFPNGQSYSVDRLCTKDQFKILRARRMMPIFVNEDVPTKSSQHALEQSIFLHKGDFIEVDISVKNLTMKELIRTVLSDLQLPCDMTTELNNIYVRKLPNTRLRRDIEVARLKDYEAIEIGYVNDIFVTRNPSLENVKNNAETIEEKQKINSEINSQDISCDNV